MTPDPHNTSPQPSIPLDDGPGLVYVATDGTRCHVDQDGWDPAVLTARERAVCQALLQHALYRLDVYARSRDIGMLTRASNERRS